MLPKMSRSVKRGVRYFEQLDAVDIVSLPRSSDDVLARSGLLESKVFLSVNLSAWLLNLLPCY